MGPEASVADSRGTSRVWSWPVLVALVALVLLWRSFELLVHPTMRVEDGAKVFAFFHDHRGIEHVFRLKSGYMPLLPNLVGYLAVRLPPPASPYFMALVPTAFSAFAYTSFFAKPFRALVQDDRLRFCACLAVALAPVGQFFLVSHTDFSIWNALFCAILWSWVPLPSSRARAIAAVLGQQLLVWTHPLSFVAAPINALQAWRSPARLQRVGQGAMLIGHVAHLVFGLEQSRAARALAPDTGDLLLRVVTYGNRFVGRALLGPAVSDWLRGHAPLLGILLALGLLALTAWFVLRNLAGLRLPVALVAYAASGVMVAVAASKPDEQIDRGIRYLYVQCLFCVLLICYLLFAWARRPRALVGPAWLRRIAAPPGAIVAAVILVFGLQNIGATRRYVERKRGDNPARVAACMNRLAALQAEHGGPCGFSLTCAKPGDWPIVFRPPRCEGGPRTDE